MEGINDYLNSHKASCTWTEPFAKSENTLF